MLIVKYEVKIAICYEATIFLIDNSYNLIVLQILKVEIQIMHSCCKKRVGFQNNIYNYV